VDCVILGASKVEQLEQNLNVIDEGPLPTEVIEGLNEVWMDLRGPTPAYNR
jgi:aryl-alcohol dehydrogenase-like predicted oxidoreductase